MLTSIALQFVKIAINLSLRHQRIFLFLNKMGVVPRLLVWFVRLRNRCKLA
jgi:hypothetical protein